MAENASLKIWNALEPLVKREIEKQTRNCQRMKSMTVSTAYNAQTGVVGVKEAFGDEIFLPVISTLDKSKLTVGANVWVSMPYSSMSNAIVTMMGDGDNGAGENVLELTATALSAKTTADRAAIYTQGVRLLKVLNGDTEVLLGLEADGSTKWLGSNKPLNNLLDNSNFDHFVNQRGSPSTAGTWTYCIDRWIADGISGQLVWHNADHVALGALRGINQPNENKSKFVGKAYTIAAKDSNGKLYVVSGIYNGDSAAIFGTESGLQLRLYSVEESTNIYCEIYNTSTDTAAFTHLKWAALYEGSYTADTLPPYTPKGYAAELAECQRYYRVIDVGNVGKDMYIGGIWNLNPHMRISPTVELVGNLETSAGNATITAGAFAVTREFARMDANITLNTFTWWKARYNLSADL